MGGCRKAVKRELLLKNGIEFTGHKVGEEAIYSFLVLLNAESYSFINETVYLYINRADSLSKTRVNDPWGDVALALRNRIQALQLYEKYAGTLNAFITTAAIVSIERLAINYSYTEYRKKAKERFYKYQNEIDNRYRIDSESLSNKALLVSPLFNIQAYTLIYTASRLRKKARN